jgi:antitoxin ParD1/3/4
MASIALGDHYEQFVRDQLASGRYNNASEVVRAALRMLEDHEAARERWLKAEVAVRGEDMRDNPAVGIPADKVFADIEARLRGNRKAS